MSVPRGSVELRAPSVWERPFLWVTVGAVALIFLAATQALAVTTVMPVVSDDLDGDRLYAVAFAGTLATSVVGMVAVGAWCDRGGVLAPLSTAVGLFVVGLLIAGLAPSMPALVAGRLVQGL
jgi:MFS family permease